MGTRGRERALRQRTRGPGSAGRQAGQAGTGRGRRKDEGRRTAGEEDGEDGTAGSEGPTASPTALPLVRSFARFLLLLLPLHPPPPAPSLQLGSLQLAYSSLRISLGACLSSPLRTLIRTHTHALTHTITTHCASSSSPWSRVLAPSLPRSLARSLACLLGDSGNGGGRTAVRGGGSRKRKRNGHGKRQGHPPSPRCPRPAVLAPPSYRAGRRAQPFRTFSPAPLRPRTPRCLVRAHACGSARYHCALSPFIAPTLSDPDLRLLAVLRARTRTFATP